MLWRYYWDSIEACANPQQIMASLSQAGLQQVGRHLELGIFSEYQAVKAGGTHTTHASTSPTT
jgi:demethylmenaquinone methyltransferase/2-methoxy-6-polyprenyl-1,4-benzoquinol methylase